MSQKFVPNYLQTIKYIFQIMNTTSNRKDNKK